MVILPITKYNSSIGKQKIIAIFILLAVLVGTGYIFRKSIVAQIFAPTNTSIPVNPPSERTIAETSEDIEVVADNLNIPWEVAFLPSGEILVTERPGQLLKIGVDRTVIEVEGVSHVGEGGLLGMALHPKFSENNWIYLYLTTETTSGLLNRVERYTFIDNTLTERKEMISHIPGAKNHDGGRIAFGPDGYLYITTGDAENPESAQDINALNGKILRITDEGSIPKDNPFGSLVYSYGHRNPQGLAWDSKGRLWATEHGRSGVQSGFDELNLIEAGNNYGWPEREGDETRASMTSPILHSGPNDTWAPAGIAYMNGRLYFAGLRGSALYRVLPERGKSEEKISLFFRETYGRLRAVQVGPDGYIYITTSNRDGRGTPKENDDKLIKIHPRVFQQ